jgi:peptide/nickel transport system substrate-binding protein
VPRFLAYALSLFVLASCTRVGTGSESAAGRHVGTVPDTLRIGSQVAPNSLNPILASNTTEGMIDRLLFDVLVTADETGKPVPSLASEVPTLENGGVSKDELSVTYHLRPNAKWQDGVPITSKDVAFTWHAIMSPRNNVIERNGYDVVSSVDTPDDRTVVFHLKKRFAPFVNTVFGESDSPFEVMPEHILGKLPDLNHIPFNSNPIGSGPFKFKEWARGDHLTFVANEDYFLGAPKLKEVVIKFVPDENTELNQLRTHDLDWQFEASPNEYKGLLTVPDVKVILQDRNEYELVQMNTKHPPLDDVRVRQAIVYAIDNQKLTHDLTAGSATTADQDLPPFMWAHAQDITRYPFNPGKAKALLAAAGWKPGADGFLEKNGQRLTLVLVTNISNATRRLAVVQVQNMLRAVGIDVQIKFYLGSLLFATKAEGGILQNGRYDLSWNGWVAGIDPDQSTNFACNAQPPNGNNTSFYCNAEMDAAQEKALTDSDIPVRKAAYGVIEALLTRDKPVEPIWWPRQIQPINPDFKGFRPNPVTASWNANQWAI